MTETRTDRGLRRKRHAKRLVQRIVIYVVLSAVGFTMVLPFLWMISTSLKTKEGAVAMPPKWIPRESKTVARFGGEEVDAHILRRLATVRRSDTGEETTVYAERLSEQRNWWEPWDESQTMMRLDEKRLVPVEVLGTTARVRILGESPLLPPPADNDLAESLLGLDVMERYLDLPLGHTTLGPLVTLGIPDPMVAAAEAVLAEAACVRPPTVPGERPRFNWLVFLEGWHELPVTQQSMLDVAAGLSALPAPACVGIDAAAAVGHLRVPRRYRNIVDLPGDDVYTRSWVSLQWDNYPTTWNKLPFARAYVNTIIMAVSITVGQVLTSSLAAFAFARLRFPGRDKLFLGYLATMMIPGAVTLIPVYILFVKMPEFLNWVFGTGWFSQDLYFLGKYYIGRLVGGNSYFALIAPGLFSAYGTFMLRQFFMGLPRELEDAARIDGCGNLRIYWHVTLPLSKVALATLATFTFMGSWKSFMWPLIINNSEQLVPLQVLLQRFQGQYGAEYTLLMAGSLIVLAPLLVVFLLMQRHFVKGIQLGGVKG